MDHYPLECLPISSMIESASDDQFLILMKKSILNKCTQSDTIRIAKKCHTKALKDKFIDNLNVINVEILSAIPEYQLLTPEQLTAVLSKSSNVQTRTLVFSLNGDAFNLDSALKINYKQLLRDEKEGFISIMLKKTNNPSKATETSKWINLLGGILKEATAEEFVHYIKDPKLINNQLGYSLLKTCEDQILPHLPVASMVSGGNGSDLTHIVKRYENTPLTEDILLQLASKCSNRESAVSILKRKDCNQNILEKMFHFITMPSVRFGPINENEPMMLAFAAHPATTPTMLLRAISPLGISIRVADKILERNDLTKELLAHMAPRIVANGVANVSLSLLPPGENVSTKEHADVLIKTFNQIKIMGGWNEISQILEGLSFCPAFGLRLLQTYGQEIKQFMPMNRIIDNLPNSLDMVNFNLTFSFDELQKLVSKATTKLQIDVLLDQNLMTSD